MSVTGQPTPCAPQSVASQAQPDPSLDLSRTLLDRSRLLGRISAFVFLLTAITVVDALQSLVRHEFNSLDLVPGETVLLSGMLPADVKTIDGLQYSIEGSDALSFKPMETYRGFWFGGHMWRAELSVAKGAEPGTAFLTVIDIIPQRPEDAKNFDDRDRAILFGGQQNPALMFTVNVWAGEAARRMGNTSFARRYTGLPAFGLAAILAFVAISLGFANWRTFCRAEAGLAWHDIFSIHGIKAQDSTRDGTMAPPGFRVEFSLVGRILTVGDRLRLLDPSWKELGRGRVVEVNRNKNKAFGFFPQTGIRPHHGWLVRLERATDSASKQG